MPLYLLPFFSNFCNYIIIITYLLYPNRRDIAMLKCVVFVVTEYGFRYLEKHRKSIDETLNGAGVKTVFLAYEETDAFAEKEVLYITDNSKTLKNLLKKK